MTIYAIPRFCVKCSGLSDHACGTNPRFVQGLQMQQQMLRRCYTYLRSSPRTSADHRGTRTLHSSRSSDTYHRAQARLPSLPFPARFFNSIISTTSVSRFFGRITTAVAVSSRPYNVERFEIGVGGIGLAPSHSYFHSPFQMSHSTE